MLSIYRNGIFSKSFEISIYQASFFLRRQNVFSNFSVAENFKNFRNQKQMHQTRRQAFVETIDKQNSFSNVIVRTIQNQKPACFLGSELWNTFSANFDTF